MSVLKHRDSVVMGDLQLSGLHFSEDLRAYLL